MEVKMPVFKHDCKVCKFLGTMRIERIDLKPNETEIHDLYFHKGTFELTVIARYGDSPCDYTSGLGLSTKELLAAQLIAVKKGMLSSQKIKVMAVDE
jgi:hypothetical protein